MRRDSKGILLIERLLPWAGAVLLVVCEGGYDVCLSSTEERTEYSLKWNVDLSTAAAAKDVGRQAGCLIPQNSKDSFYVFADDIHTHSTTTLQRIIYIYSYI